MTGRPINITEQIRLEIAKTIIRLGGNPARLNLADTWALNRTLEFLGADTHLLCTVGSWGDTMSDQEVLRDLQAWNEGKSLAPELSFISRY